MAADDDRDKPPWAGRGHRLGCLLQTMALLVVNLGVWGFIFLLALDTVLKYLLWFVLAYSFGNFKV